MSTFNFVKLKNFAKNQKYLVLRPPMPHWVILTQNTLFWHFTSTIKKKKNCIISEISNLKFAKLQNFAKRQKYLSLSYSKTKIVLFWYFWVTSLRNYCLIWNQQPQICQVVNFCEKKISWTWEPKMPYFGILGVEL